MSTIHRKFFAALVGLLVLLGVFGSSSWAYTAGSGVTIGPAQTVYDWDMQKCDSSHIPDQPARAFRDNLNRVQVNISNGEPPYVRAQDRVGARSVGARGNRRIIGASAVEGGQAPLHPLQPEHLLDDVPRRRACADSVVHTNAYMPNYPNSSPLPDGRYGADNPPTAAYNPVNPGNFHDREWLNGMWAADDGLVVQGFFHNNFQGWRDLDGTPGVDGSPPFCDLSIPAVALKPQDYCWYAAITTAKSIDGGATYGVNSVATPWHHLDPPNYDEPPHHAIATSPYQYVPNAGRQGYSDLFTNVIKHTDGFYYMMFTKESQGASDTTRGNCVMRTNDIDDPDSWLAWKAGSGYTVDFMNPYTSSDPPANHLCTPVSSGTLLDQLRIQGLYWSRYYNKYMLIGWRLNLAGTKRNVYFSLAATDDLSGAWGVPQLLMSAPASVGSNGDPPDCNDKPAGYPSILDDNDPAASTSSPERNFFQPDQNAYLYFSRLNNNGSSLRCPGNGADKDLARVPVRFPTTVP